MADIGITKYRARVIKENALPSNPGNPATNPVDPVNPPASGGGLTGVNQFIQLTDTPASYSGATLNYARVNAGETGLEFRTPAQVLTDIGGIGGTGTTNYIPKFTASGTIGDSGIFDNGSNIEFITAQGNIQISRSASSLSFTRNSSNWIRASVLGGSLFFSVNGDGFSNPLLSLVSTGRVGINNTTAPTETLDVNGTARIRTINNLGSTPTEVLVPSATGVISKRTLTEFKSELGVVESINAGAGIQVNPNPTASTPQVALTGQALSFHSLTGDGFVYRTSGVVGVRTLTAGTGITITNGDGIAGNPVISATGSIIVQRGTFTPTLSASGLSFTYTTQTGFYTQIDDLVFVYIEIIFTSSGTPSGGNLRVSNLPKQGLASEAQHLPVEKMQNSGYSSADVSRLTFRIDGNLTRGDVVFKNSSIAPLTTYGSGCLLVIQGVYKTSSP